MTTQVACGKSTPRLIPSLHTRTRTGCFFFPPFSRPRLEEEEVEEHASVSSRRCAAESALENSPTRWPG